MMAIAPLRGSSQISCSTRGTGMGIACCGVFCGASMGVDRVSTGAGSAFVTSVTPFSHHEGLHSVECPHGLALKFAEASGGTSRKSSKNDVGSRKSGVESALSNSLQATANEVSDDSPADCLGHDEAKARSLPVLILGLILGMQSRVGDAKRSSHAAAGTHDAPVVVAPGNPMLPARHSAQWVRVTP